MTITAEGPDARRIWELVNNHGLTPEDAAATRSDADPQKAVNAAANGAGGAQERSVAMGRETADAIEEVAR